MAVLECGQRLECEPTSNNALGLTAYCQVISQALMRRVDAEADRAKARTLWLGVWEHNERAKAFHRQCRFVDVGAHVFTVGSDAQTDHILVRPVEHVVSAISR